MNNQPQTDYPAKEAGRRMAKITFELSEDMLRILAHAVTVDKDGNIPVAVISSQNKFIDDTRWLCDRGFLYMHVLSNYPGGGYDYRVWVTPVSIFLTDAILAAYQEYELTPTPPTVQPQTD